MDRIPVNTRAPLERTFYDGTTIVDPDAVTVNVTRDDGTSVIVDGPTTGIGAGPRSFELTAAQNTLLDKLTVEWVSPTLGTVTSVVEVVGGFLFSLHEVTGADDADIREARTRAEQTLEQAVGFAFVPRYARVTLSGVSGALHVGRPYLRRIRWATVSGTALATADLAALSYDSIGNVYGYGWSTGYGNIVAGVEHGRDEPDEPVRAAARELATFYLQAGGSGVDPRAERIITVDGTLVFGSGHTGLPSVDRVIDYYRLPAVA